jgi:hypothetical protein
MDLQGLGENRLLRPPSPTIFSKIDFSSPSPGLEQNLTTLAKETLLGFWNHGDPLSREKLGFYALTELKSNTLFRKK